MIRRYKITLLTVFLLSWNFLSAQVFPVQVSTQLRPPYSVYLSDYVAPGSERLMVMVLLKDVSQPSLNVKFRLRIEGEGLLLETKPEYIPAPVSLQGGIPLQLTSVDLAQYFEPRNLNFLQGLTQREYKQKGKLPEGIYSFCFEVLEYNRSVKISNTGCGRAWMILNDPPIVNLPRQNEKLRPVDPQNVIIQWTPRHTGSPNSAFNTEYEIEMVEVWPSTRNPNDAILTSPKILQATTQNTTFIYGPSEVQLEPGRRYAFRIRAKSIVGLDELDLFKNNGYSEVYSFIYGDACGLPTNIVAESSSSSKINLKWDVLDNHSSFKVNYRPIGTQNWYTNTGVLNDMTITSLKPATVYEYQVMGLCSAVEGVFTNVATVKTQDAPEENYSCGLPLLPFNLDPSKLTGSLRVGDVINAGDFDVELTKVTGSGGTFSGEGLVVMPIMDKIRVKTEFTNITVAGVPTATDYRMVNGFMKVTGGKVVIVPEAVMNVVNKVDNAFDKIDKAIDVIEQYVPREGPDPASFAADSLVAIKGEIALVVPNNADGKVYVTTKDGKVTTLSTGQGYAITDTSGKGYVVDSKGGITKTTADAATKAANRKYNFAVQFSNVTSITARGGFDRYTGNTIFSSTYESLDETYFVPWKASAQNGVGSLSAVLTDRSLDASKVKFDMIDVQATSTLIGNRWTFNITSALSGKIIAYYPSTGQGDKEQILGKVNIQGFDPKPYKLVIVKDVDGNYPFTNKKVQVLTDSLNRIYGQALVSWQVSYEERDFNIDKSFDAGNSSLLSNYTADMRKLISAYGPLQNETYYLFVIDKPTNSGDVVGFMPRSRQAGFIYTNANTTPALLIHTAAHELGHGVFNLNHIFGEFSGLAEGATNNLMDYKDNMSHQLMRFQWERIHDPVTVIGLFEDDEDSQYNNKTYVQKVLQQLRCASIEGKSTVEDLTQGTFVATLDLLGTVRLTISDKPVVLKRGIALEHQSGGGMQSKLMQTVKYGGLQLDYYGDRAGFDIVQNYIFPADRNVGASDAAKVLKIVLDKPQLSDDDIEEIRGVANCGARYFSVTQKLAIISKIQKSQFFITESYEDLILDLIENYEGDYATYAQEFITKLSVEHYLIKQLFYGMDNGVTVFNKENNADRFIQLIYSLWTATSQSSKNNYTYIENVIGGSQSSPYCLPYQGKSLFPLLNYQKPAFKDGKVLFLTELSTAEGIRNWTFEYNYFQPIFLIREQNGLKITYLSTDVPAIMFAGLIEKDNFDRVINRTSLGADVILTFTGAGNLTKLRHLSKAQKLGRVVLAGLEFSTSALDVILNYTELCTDPEFCAKLKAYNFYIQMGLLGGEAVSALYKSGMSAAKASAKDAYLKSRPAIVAKYGNDSDRVKLLDEHFGIGIVRFVAKDANELKAFLAKLIDKPVYKTYEGDVYRSLSKSNEKKYGAVANKMTPTDQNSSWGRYDLDKEENAMYLSKTEIGNYAELIPHYGEWTDFNTYKFTNVKIEKLLDLTNDRVRQQLGVTEEMLTKVLEFKGDMYEFTNVLASWGRLNGYNGIVAPGARGVKDYENIVLFDQDYIDLILKDQKGTLIPK